MSQFFAFPHNLHADLPRSTGDGNVVNVFGDGRRDNYVTASRYRLLSHQVDAPNDTRHASRISHVYLRAKNVTSYALSVPSGFGTGAAINRVIPTTISTPEGRSISNREDGISADLLEIETPYQATAVDIVCTGTDIEVYDILLLDEILELDSDSRFIKMVAGLEHRSAAHYETTRGQRFQFNTAPQQSWKWGVAYGARFIGIETYDALLDFMRTYQNFAFAEDYYRFPQRVYPATFKNYGVTLELITRWRGSGTDIYFDIAEI